MQRDHLLAQFQAVAAQQVGVDQRTVALDARQHRHQRHLDVAQHARQRRRGLQLSPECLVQAQGDVGVLGRVGAGLLEGNLVEGQLLGALAGDVLETDGFVLEVALRQAVHVVTGRRGVQRVGLEHGVEGHAAHLDRHRGVGQHVDVVLGVLADLGLVRVFEQRFERAQHGVAVELCRHAHVGMRQGHVGGLERRHREGHPDQLGDLRIDAGGLGVEGEQLGGLQLLQPGVEPRLVENGFVLLRHFRLQVIAAWRRHVRRVEQTTAGGLLELPGLRFALQVFQPALEFQRPVERGERLAIGLAGVQRVDLDVQRHVQLDGRQLVGEVGHLLVLFELGGQRLGSAQRQLGDLSEVGVDHIQPATDAGQQAHRGFFANAGHAGDVVDLVAHQRQVVDDQLGADTELLDHAGRVHHQPGHGVDQGDVRADQLRHVLVAGGNHHVAFFAGGLARQRADHVVGFDAFDAQQREAQRANAGVQRLDLVAQVIGHRRPVGLVVGKDGVAEGAALGIENHREGAVRILFAQALEHVQHALHRAGLHAFGGGQRRQGVEGAVQVGRAVHQDEGGLGHAWDQPFA